MSESVEKVLDEMYQLGLRQVDSKSYADAFETFQQLIGTSYPDVDQNLKYVTAALLCQDGFYGKALVIYNGLDTFKNSKILATKIRHALSCYNGFYSKAEDCFAKYLFIEEDKVCFETSHLYDGTINFQHDLQRIDNRIYARYTLEDRLEKERDYSLTRLSDGSVLVEMDGEGKSQFCGVYAKCSDNPRDVSAAKLEDPFSFFDNIKACNSVAQRKDTSGNDKLFI